MKENGITYESIKNHILIVGATNQSNLESQKDIPEGDYQLTGYSNYGKTVDICAPGVCWFSTTANNGYEQSSGGTSMSASLVAGSVAYIWPLRPDMSAKQVRDIILTSTTHKAHGIGDDAGSTYPMLNVGQAARAVMEPTVQGILDAYDEACTVCGRWMFPGYWRGPSDEYVETYELGKVKASSTDHYGKHCLTYDDNVKSINELKGLFYRHFSTKYADDFLADASFVESDGKLYKYYGGGWGAAFSGIVSIDRIEQTGKNTFEMTVIGDDGSIGGADGRYTGKLKITYQDGRYHFEPIGDIGGYPDYFMFWKASNMAVPAEIIGRQDPILPTTQPETSESGDTQATDLPLAQLSSTPETADAVEFNGHRYCVYNVDTVTDWNSAQAYCEERGGHLATITSAEEDAFLYSYIVDAGYHSAMFGLSEQEKADDWRWVTGESLSYQNWHLGEPNHQGGYEHYGMYYKKFTDGTWNDGSGLGGPFICEWENMGVGGRVSVEVIPGEQQRVGAYNVTVDTLSVTIPGNQKAADKIMKVFLDWKEEKIDEFADSGSDDSGMGDSAENGFSSYTELTVQRADSKIISVYLYTSTHFGSGTGVQDIKGFTFSTQSGDVLELSDLTNNVAALSKALCDIG